MKHYWLYVLTHALRIQYNSNMHTNLVISINLSLFPIQITFIAFLYACIIQKKKSRRFSWKKRTSQLYLNVKSKSQPIPIKKKHGSSYPLEAIKKKNSPKVKRRPKESLDWSQICFVLAFLLTSVFIVIYLNDIEMVYSLQ